MSATEIQSLVLGALQGLATTTGFILVLWIGFCVVFGLTKFRTSGRGTRTFRGLDELVGKPTTFLSPDTPRGYADQLHTPELLEAAARKSQ